jgi:hypothetical protein
VLVRLVFKGFKESKDLKEQLERLVYKGMLVHKEVKAS